MKQAFAAFLFFLVFWASTGGCFRTEKTKKDLDRIGVMGKWMTDSSSRVRIFHGFNAVNKGFPWYPENLLNETKLQLYKSWGFNAVRLGTMWTGAMPNKGGFNETYIGILQEIIKKLSKYGIYALLDMHQDVLSTKYGAYDGAPRWVIDALPPSPHPYPWPLKNISQWAEGYLAEATGRGFQGIYDNTAHARDYYIQFWKKIASTFKGNTAVIGYELINEPWAGDIYSDPLLLLPGEAGTRNLLRLYDLVNNAVRKIDNTTLLFYEPVTWGMVFEGGVFGSGFNRVPGGDAYRDKSILSYHYYCWAFEFGTTSIPQGLKRVICDKLLGPKVFETITKDLQKTGGGSFLTEFGECEPDGNPNSTQTVECNFVMSQTDKHLQSWTYWDSQFFDATGNVNWNIAKAFARPYARAIAGVPTLMNFDPRTKIFNMTYTLNTAIKGPTEIIAPRLQYPMGVNILVSPPDMSFSYDKSTGLILITPKPPQVANGTHVVVCLSQTTRTK